MTLLTAIFAILLLACQYKPFDVQYLAAIWVLMIASILYRQSGRRIIIIFLIIGISFVALSHHADYEYAVLKFNSGLYPVSVYDYGTLAAAIYFSYRLAAQKPLFMLQFLELFGCFSAFLITLDIFRWLDTGVLPVYSNYNWLGTLIVAFLFLSLNVLLRNGVALLTILITKQSLRSPRVVWTLAKILLFSWIVVANSYLLLETGSRSAAIAFILGLPFVITFYAYLVARHLAGQFRLNFWAMLAMLQAALLGLVAAFIPFIVNSRFYARLSQFLERGNPVRSHIYTCYLNLLTDHPLLGAGMGRSAQLCEKSVSEIMGRPNNAGNVNHAHNFLLQIAGNHGLFGLIVIIIFIGIYILQICKLRHQFSDINSLKKAKRFSVIFHLSLTALAMIFISLFQSSIYHVPFLQIWLGLLIGVTVAVVNPPPKSAQSNEPIS